MLLPDSPAKVWENPGAQNLGVQAFVVAAPLNKELLNTGWRAPKEVHLGRKKAPHPRRKGTVDENMVNRFQVMLAEAASSGDDMASLS